MAKKFWVAIMILLVIGIIYEISKLGPSSDDAKEFEKKKDTDMTFPKVKSSIEEKYSPDAVLAVIKDVTAPLKEDIFATYQGQEMRVPLGTVIESKEELIFLLAHQIFYTMGSNAGLGPDRLEVLNTMTDLMNDGNRPFHDKIIKKLGMEEVLYWHRVEEQVEMDLVAEKYAESLIGKPEELDGNQYKRAYNQLMYEMIIKNHESIQVNETIAERVIPK
ncbi:hypothetical protein [Peribacillus sp. SCS-155]|uniref:hypothetical protein n=1 Tax=Peribacillus sedimenti TaxID=3115297 RepID=UPI00390620F1